MNLHKLLPEFNRAKNRWEIDVPRSLNKGVRKRFYFKTADEANKAHADLIYSLTLTGSIPLSAGPRESVAYFAAQFLAKKSLEVEMVSMRQLKWGMKYFCEKWGSKRPEDLKSADLRAWIDSLPLTTRGRWNVFAVCRDFFNSPIGQEAVAKNPFNDAPPKREKGARLSILTLDQMRALLAHEWPDWFKAWLVAGAFAGLRTREVFALDNSAIDWEYGEIVVRREDAKQGKAARPRSASIQEPLVRHMPRRKGPLTGGWWKKGWERAAKEACAVIGVEGAQEWPSNCLRHSFASYHLAHFKDATKTAYEMGSSPDLIYSTYANLVSRRDAAKWWEL